MCLSCTWVSGSSDTTPMAFQNLNYWQLQSGDVDPATLRYEPLGMAAPGPPVLDAERPESFGRPNYDSNHFYSVINEALRSVFDDVAWVVTIATPVEGSVNTQTFVYHDADSVTAVRLIDETGDYERWLSVLAEPFGNRPVKFSFNEGQQGSGRAIHLDRLATDPASWIIDSGPSSWIARSQATVKQSILEAAQRVAGPPNVTNPDEIASLWSELVEVAGFDTTPGATTDDLDSFRQVTGFHLPDGLAVLLSLSNGAAGAFGFRSLMSVAEITRQWVGWKQIFDDFLLDDLQNHYTSDQKRTVGMYTTPHWVSFVDESTGNYAAIDLLPGPAGRQGQIIYFGADQDLVRWLACDVADFLRREIAQVRNANTGGHWF